MLRVHQKAAFVAVAILISGCTASEDSSNSSNERGKTKSSLSQSEKDVVRDGPFGLAMGQPIAELKFAQSDQGDPTQARILASVPRPMSEIETYAVLAFPDTGICEIRAVSKTFDSDAYGHNIRPAMDSLAVALDGRYGKHQKIDRCSGYGGCQFFQMGLKDGSKAYAYEWSKKTGAKVPESLESIALFAMPGEFNDTFFRLDYVSSNRKDCEAANQKVKAQSL